MANELKSDLKHKFYIKCIIDVCVFIISVLFFIIFAKIKAIAPYDTFLFMIILTTVNGVTFFITRLSTLSTINRAINQQSSSFTNAAQDILDIVASQKKTMEAISENTKEFSELISSLKSLSNSSISTSKNTERQINQSITFSQKESEAISSNAEKMLILRQKIQMIAELVLELSEHTQQIGSSISVVDDIAEQTNMLALNAAVEAARAGEHGKGFAVVAGEIRKLADESKQAITKITSLTSNIQYTTNSTVMATEEGSKEIEAVVKDINSLAADSDNLYNLIKDTLESLDLLNNNAKKREEIIEKLDNIDKKTTEISLNLMQNISANTEKIANLESLSKEIKNSVSEG